MLQDDDWEVLDARANKRSNSPHISITKQGCVQWNAATHQALNEPTVVNLLFNSKTKRLAIRPSERKGDIGHAVSRIGKQNSFAISAYGALQSRGISVTTPHRYSPVIENGVVIIDISDILEV